MATKAESDLLTQVLTSNCAVDGDIKFVMDKVVAGKSGTVKLVEGYGNTITQATFLTKRKVKRAREEVTLNIKFHVQIIERSTLGGIGRNKTPTRTRQLKVWAERSGYKGEKQYSTEYSAYFSPYNTMVELFYVDRDKLDIAAILDQVVKNTQTAIRNAKNQAERQARFEESEKRKAAKTKADLLAEFGLQECDIVNKAYEKAMVCAWGAKGQIRKNFEFYAVCLKANLDDAVKKVAEDGQ